MILETKNLTKHFEGVAAVDKLSVGIEEGKITSFVGPNGAGKTTLVNLLSGMFPFDTGAIKIGNEKLEKVKPYNVAGYGITRTFQTIRLFEQMTVLDNVLVVLTERGVLQSLFEKHSSSHLKKAEELLTKVNLWEKKNDLALNLSYGQRKLLEISRALAMDPKIILFDEPFSGLFREMVKIVKQIIIELKQQGKTVVLIEHNMDLIRELSDHVIVMDSGALLSQGKPNKVLEEKKVVEAYLGE